MNRARLALVLSAFGVFVLGCDRAAPTGASSASVVSGDDEVEAYAASDAFRALPESLRIVVRATLASARPLSRHALIGLFASPRFVALATSAPAVSCSSGVEAATIIVAWGRDGAALRPGETEASADQRHARYVDEMNAKLAVQDTAQVDRTLAAIMYGGCDEQSLCMTTHFATPTCGSTGQSTQTSWAMREPSGGRLDLDAHAMLADRFARIDAVAPSRATVMEWDALRARFQARRGAADIALRAARRGGSATLARDPLAARRFDAATRLVDSFQRARITPTADAMNLVHATLGGARAGQLRTAGEEVSMGRSRARRYLPGSVVGAATADMFAALGRARANGPLAAAQFETRAISIHPYADANGRTTRLMTDWILAQGGYPPAIATGPSSIVLTGTDRFEKGAHLARITLGMRRAVELLEQV